VQYWLDLFVQSSPDYNILKFSRSSRGYKNTRLAFDSIAKMKGPRPNFKPSP